MGVMVDGVYVAEEDSTKTTSTGEWQRSKSVIRNWITPDGAAGPAGGDGFAAEDGRYHLYAAWNCPWAHRALLTRKFKKLEDLISVSYARPNRTADGWVYDADGEFADETNNISALHEVYAKNPDPYTGRITVPVIWDTKRKRIVSNESADIVRMLNSAFKTIAEPSIDLYPADKAAEIDRWNDFIYPNVNNGVYRAGFASTQEAYQKAAFEVFEALDKIDAHLADNRYLAGNHLTEADVRLFPTLARFDVAYHYAFRCNLKKLSDYENLWPYAREIHQMPGIAGTVRFDIYKMGYFSASEKRNPLGIVPIGPQIDWSVPHGRG